MFNQSELRDQLILNDITQAHLVGVRLDAYIRTKYALESVNKNREYSILL